MVSWSTVSYIYIYIYTYVYTYLHKYIYVYSCIYMYTYWRDSFLKHDMSASGDHNANCCFPSGRLLRSNLQGASHKAFAPAIVGMSGQIHADFLRLLWVLAEKQLRSYYESMGKEDKIGNEAFRWARAKVFNYNKT